MSWRLILRLGKIVFGDINLRLDVLTERLAFSGTGGEFRSRLRDEIASAYVSLSDKLLVSDL